MNTKTLIYVAIAIVVLVVVYKNFYKTSLSASAGETKTEKGTTPY